MRPALHELTYTSVLVRLLLATVVGGVIGWERGRRNRPAGLRTFILVCLGAAIVMMTNQYLMQCYGTGDPARMGAQVISGIGFLGAGSIVVTRRNQIRGITTAAGLWAAACVGLAIGIGFYEVAVLGAVVVFVVLTLVYRFDAVARRMSNVLDLYVELSKKEAMTTLLRSMREAGLKISNLQMETENAAAGETVAFIATVRSLEKRPRESVLELLRAMPDVNFVEEL